MKKIIMLFMVALLFSCSKEELEVPLTESSHQSKEILSFSSKESFVQEYLKISKFQSQKDFDTWFSEKGHKSLLKKSDSILNSADSLGVLYSDALMALFNSDGLVEIAGNKILLNKGVLYTVSNDFKENATNISTEVFGRIHNKSSTELNSKSFNKNPGDYIPNANRWKKYVNYYGSRRLITELFNETLIFDNNAYSSKMYLRFRMDYESCSFWRCTWKNDATTYREINLRDIHFGANQVWQSTFAYNTISNMTFTVQGHYTMLLATHNINYAQEQNFFIYGSVKTTVIGNGHVWDQGLSWY